MNTRFTVTWPIVALTLVLVGAFVGLFALIPPADSISRTALLAVVVTVANGVVAIATSRLGRRVEGLEQGVDEVKKLVNGHTSDLIARIPEANRTPAQRARERGPAGGSLPGPEPRI